MKRKKILQVIERFNVAGAEVVVKDLLLNLPRSRWDTEVCVLHDIGVLGNELKEQGYLIHHLDWEKEKLTDFQVMRKLNTLIKERKADLIHSHNLTPWYFSTFASLFLRPKRCVTIHGFLWGTNTRKRKLLYGLLPLFASDVILVSENIRTQFESPLFLDPKKLRTIVNGVDIRIADPEFDRSEKRKSLGLSEDAFVLGTVSRAYPEKNIEMQIELVHALRSEIPNIRLVVVAKKYDHFKHLESLVNRLNVRDKIIFTDERRDVPELLKTFDIFIMTSFSEATSLALLEAMASGLPVVVSDVGGNSGIVSHEENGLLFDVHDAETFRSHILRLFHDKEIAKRLARRAEETGRRYSVENMINQYDRVYSEMSA